MVFSNLENVLLTQRKEYCLQCFVETFFEIEIVKSDMDSLRK